MAAASVGVSGLMATHAPARANEPMRFASPVDAFQQGVAAYRARHFEIAIPALKAAHEAGIFFAPFYLARIYASGDGAYTNHAKAYRLYTGIVERYGHVVDNDDYRRATTVAKAITAMATYVARGLPEIGLAPDKKKAIRFYRYAAQFFGEDDAQFELAKLQLIGDGVSRDPRTALYWLQRLVRRGHTGAQAFLADLMWRGKHVKRNPSRALALIDLARRSAPVHERIWVNDYYQNIYCGASDDVRRSAAGHVAGWEQKFHLGGATRSQSQALAGLGTFKGPVRECRNGEPIRSLRDLSDATRAPTNPAREVGPGAQSSAGASGEQTAGRNANDAAQAVMSQSGVAADGNGDVIGPPAPPKVAEDANRAPAYSSMLSIEIRRGRTEAPAGRMGLRPAGAELVDPAR